MGSTTTSYRPSTAHSLPSITCFGQVVRSASISGFSAPLYLAGIFLYPLRKHWPWLSTIGSTRHWLDIHILMGLTAPAIVAFHSTLKFKGLAGMAFWIMFAVSASGVVGRYLYGQIPRKVTTAELSLRELHDLQADLSQQLAAQNLLPADDLRALLRLPDADRVARLPIAVAIVYMMLLDVARKFRVARLRRHALRGSRFFSTLAGFLPTNNREVERAIHAAAEEAALSKEFCSSPVRKRFFIYGT